MTAFVIVMAVVLGLDTGAKLVRLASSAKPGATFALDTLLNICLLGWAIGLLAS